MAKITKLVFDVKGKEYVFSYDDAKQLYQEMGKIFNAKPTKEQFEYDPPPVGAILPIKDDYISFGATYCDTITGLNNSMINNIKGDDGVFGATMNDSITLIDEHPYDWISAPPAKKYCQCS